jgi:hypothetical protein
MEEIVIMEQLDLSLVSPVLHNQAREAFEAGDVVGLLISMDNLKSIAFVVCAIPSIRRRLQNACERANLSDVTPHTLWHRFASRLGMAGINSLTLKS